jgi:putative protease
LKDLNLSSYIKDLVDIGVESFKIEGRLKDENYVSNVTNYYSSHLNQLEGLKRTGSGKVIANFTPDPERSFNRGCSTYFIRGREKELVNSHTPKSMGKQVGILKQIKGQRIWVDALEPIHNGDGLCYLDKGELKGIRVNRVDGNWIECNESVKIKLGTMLYRNYDHHFAVQLEKAQSVRKIAISMQVSVVRNQLKVIVKLGLLHLQYNARWQLAELLYRRRPENWKIHLNELSNDEHHYVRKRALNCIELLNNDG